jgi:hypothetical protein
VYKGKGNSWDEKNNRKIMRLMELLGDIIKESQERNLNEYEATWFYESRYIQELVNPEMTYEFEETNNNSWEFQDKYGNIIGVEFNPSNKYFETFYIVKDLNGKDLKVFDFQKVKDQVDPTSFQGGSDDRRSDTWVKILRDEIIPKFLSDKPSMIKIHPIDEYRFNIFWKAAEVCKEKHPYLEIKQFGKEILILNK